MSPTKRSAPLPQRRLAIVLALLSLTTAWPAGRLHAQSPGTTRTVGAAAFDVKVVGKGPPMLFIPGLTSGGAVWDEIVARFADRYECHVFTLAGFAGQPPVATDSLWLERMREAIVAYVKSRGLSRPVIVGHSLGGHLALDLAARVPSLPRAIVNVDGLPFIGATMSPNATVATMRPIAQQMRANTRAGAGAADSTTRQRMAQMQEMQLRSMVRDTTRLPMIRTMGRTSDPATVAEALYGLYTADLRASLSQVTVPVLNVHAWAAYRPMGQTRERTEQLLADQYAALKSGTTVIHDSAYHFIMLDEPQWLVAEMQRFLSARR